MDLFSSSEQTLRNINVDKQSSSEQKYRYIDL